MLRLPTNLLDDVTTLLRTVSETEILPRFGTLARTEITRKSADNDLVTAADLATEAALTRGLLKLVPDALVIGEEAVFTNNDLLDVIEDQDLTFIVDPIDGTWNFAHGMPLFGSMIAATMKGETVGAWIHYPLSGETLVAERGSGAVLIDPNNNRQDCRVSARNTLSEMAGFLALPIFSDPDQAHIAPLLPQFGDVTSYFCSAYEYRMLVTGAKDFALNGKMMPWDHAAGQLLHREAGGYSALCDGTPYHPYLTEGPFLLAPCKDSWQDIRDTLMPRLRKAQ